MDIRETEFWQSIEQIFPDREATAPVPAEDVPGRGRRLSSYAHFLDRLSLSVQRAQRHGNQVLLLLLQLTPNDRQRGQTAVDRENELLICRLSSCLRADDSVCRLGTNRFALLLEDLKEHTAAPLVLEKLVTTLVGSVKPEGQSRRVALNIGATLFPADGVAFDSVLESAEAALQQAIEAGPGTCRIAPKVTGRAAMERFEFSKDLYKAHRNREFETVYQPVFDLRSKRILAVEAFLRWRHPLHGMVSPETFLPLLEDSGVIVPVGERLIAETCMLLRSLHDYGCPPVRACVNVSARQLEDSGFLLSVLDALYEADLDPGLLQLEFSEHVLVSRPKLMQRLLPELQNAGVRLALDQFGVGEAPLADLIRLPINLIKIDRSLIERLLEDSVSKAVTSGALALANSAGMQVAAVGVEQRLQTGVLEKLGCDEAQGSYFSCPVTGAELRTLLNA